MVKQCLHFLRWGGKKSPPLRPFSKKKCMNENCVPVYRARRLPDGARNCDAFRVFFFRATTALCCQRFKLSERRSAGGASEHLKCDLACESTQTALVEIRLDEHDWSQTNNLRSLAASRGTAFRCRARVKRISHSVLPGRTYFISAGERRRVCCSRRGGSVQFAVPMILRNSWIAGVLDHGSR